MLNIRVCSGTHGRRTLICVVLLSVIFGPGVVDAQVPKTRVNATAPTATVRVFEAGSNAKGRAAIERWARQILLKQDQKVRFAIYYLNYGDKWPNLTYPDGHWTHGTYQSARKIFLSQLGGRWPLKGAAQLLYVNGRATVRYHNGSYAAMWNMKGQKDAAILRAGVFLRFAHLEPPGLGFEKGFLSVWAQTGSSLTSAHCASLSDQLLREAGVSTVHLTLRKDNWFSKDRGPLLYPYQSPEALIPPIGTASDQASIDCSAKL